MDVTELDEIATVTVVGAGSMGHGIAQVFATEGYDVTLVDIADEPLSNALENVERSLRRLDIEPEPVLDRIATTTDRTEGLAGADLMVEAVPENIELKTEVFAAADDALGDRAILATNTSTLPITELAAATDRPEQVVGMHFSNPPPLMPIVEVIRGDRTSDAVFATAEALSEAVGKTPVLIEKDVPGFLLNRLNYAFWNEALRRLDRGEQTPERIDASVQRLGFPMGPFEVLDFAGIDVFYMVCQSMQARDVPVEITETHETLIENEHYGMKSGAGFYEYPAPGAYARVDIPLEERYAYNPYYMIASAVNEAAWLLDNDVTTRTDIDKAMRIGMSWPRGPLRFADEYGIDRVVETLEHLFEESGWKQYEPHPRLEAMVESGKLGVKSGAGFYEYDHERERFDTVEYRREESLAVVDVPSFESIDGLTWQGIRDALAYAREDDAVRATLLRRRDEPTDDTPTREHDGDEPPTRSDVVSAAVDELRTHPKPTVCLVEHAVFGPGCGLVLLCDMAVAAAGSHVGAPCERFDPSFDAWLSHGSTNIGEKKLLELAMTDNVVSATEAAEFGLFNYVVDGDQAAAVARELARSTTDSSPSGEQVKARWNEHRA